MVDKFVSYNKVHQLFDSTDKIILAVSGGKDSTAMVHLFLRTKITIALAHCNFKLRGEASDGDESFVKELARKNKIPFYSTSFDTESHAKKNKISIQMAARDLRYAWFRELIEKYGYRYVATAHHKDDVAETMLMNLVRGTGIAGLHGIKNKLDTVIRPMLCFTREEIDLFSEENNMNYRDDLSNNETKYVRNKIRHDVIPSLKTINPKLTEALCSSAAQFANLEEVINAKVEEEKLKCIKEEKGLIKIDVKAIKMLRPLSTYLYHFIAGYGFNLSDADNIIQGMDDQSGKRYFSGTHILIRDRDYLLIRRKDEKTSGEYRIISMESFNDIPIPLDAKIMDVGDIKMETNSNYAYLDRNKLTFPLTLRKWKKGDIFFPFGMKGSKKVSDYFIDNKLSLFDKRNTWILTDFEDQIIWLVGGRIDDRFKVNEETRTVLTLFSR